MSILCIGQAAYDITFPIDTKIVENQKYRIMDKIECMGGPAANAAYLCAKWGASSILQARLGDDIYGKKIVEILEQIRVNTDCMHIDDHFETSISGIIANRSSGHRTIFNCPGIVQPIVFPKPKQTIDVILVDGHEPDASFQALRDFPYATSIIDAGTLRDATRDLAKEVDYLICSQDFAYQYTGIMIDHSHPENWEKVMKKLHELNPRHIAVTMGSDGLIYDSPQGIQHMSAFEVSVVDSCGAGDIFHGAFAYCIAKQYTFVEALKISSMTSAISVESYGSQLSIPDKEIVNKRLKSAMEEIRLI